MVPIAPLTRPTLTQRLLVSMTRAELAKQMTASSPPASSAGSCVDSFDGGNWLATGTKLSNVVLYNCFNCWNEMEGSDKGRNILYVGGSLGHETVPVSHSDSGVSQPQ